MEKVRSALSTSLPDTENVMDESSSSFMVSLTATGISLTLIIRIVMSPSSLLSSPSVPRKPMVSLPKKFPFGVYEI